MLVLYISTKQGACGTDRPRSRQAEAPTERHPGGYPLAYTTLTKSGYFGTVNDPGADPRNAFCQSPKPYFGVEAW